MHYSDTFKDAIKPVQDLWNAGKHREAKVAFKEAMLRIGHEERIKNLYRVQDKLSHDASFFQPNQPQEQYLKTRASRNIILKCRQVGFTTLNCIRALDYALWQENYRTGVLCHKLATVKTIFNDITKFCYDWFIRDWGHLYKPVEKSDSASSLSFSSDGLGNPLNSSILVLHDFRGKTIHFLHVSEAARIESDRLVGSLNGVPDNGEVTLESTAHGRSGEFYRQWQLHKARGNTAPYKGFFIPWYKYYPEDLDKWDFEETPQWSAREVDLLNSYKGKVSKAHLLWRRFCIEAKCEGNEETFENEYPTNDIDCFLSGEASVFPGTVLKMQDRNTRDPIFTGFLISHGSKMEIHDDPKGIVSIWEEPDPSHTYVLGADPAGGVGQDLAAAYVKDCKTNKLVARIHGDLIPADFAREIFKLCSFYNKAWACIEANNHGQVVIHVLKEMRYPNLYKRHTIDEITSKPTKKIGFMTTNQSKMLITEKFKNAAKEGKIVILDRDLVSEMSSFVQIAGKTGNSVRREAGPGAHDDLVMAASLTEEMHTTRNVEAPDERYDTPSEVAIDPETGFIVGEYSNA